MYTRYLVGAVSVLVLAATSTSSALAAPCGQPGTDSAEPAKAELALDSAKSDDPALPSFEGNTDKKDVVFLFSVTGCTLGSGSDVKVRAAGDGSGAVKFARPVPKGDVLVITAVVDPNKFDPGTHKPTVVISSASGQAKTQSLKLTLERKEPPLWPVVLSLVALALGLFYAYELARQAATDAYDKKKAARGQKTPPEKAGFVQALTSKKPDEDKVQLGGLASWLGVLVGAAGAAGAAFAAGYIKSATWSLDFPNPYVLAVAVAAAAAGGATAGLTKAVTAHDLPEPPAGNN